MSLDSVHFFLTIKELWRTWMSPIDKFCLK
jgi:hypothetical protein